MKKIIFSALVAIVAVGGAFAGNAASKLIPATGYQFNASAPCSEEVAQCQTTGPAPCTYSGSIQAYGNTSSTPGTCTVALRRL